MTANQSQQLIGKRARYTLGELSFDVTIIDVKTAYGCTRYLITPLNGSGSQWVQTNLRIGEGQ